MNKADTVHRLDEQTIPPFLLLVQPGERRRIWKDHKNPAQIVLGATLLGQPAGIAVGVVNGAFADLTDLYVLPAYRRGGIGGALLAALEKEAIEARAEQIGTLYRPDEHTPVFARLLHTQGWTTPIPRSKVFWTRCAVAFGPWVSRYRFRPPYETFAWPDLTESERTRLAERGKSGWYPPMLSPFHRPNNAWDGESSVGLRCNGEVVGWCLTVREAPQQMLVDILFVDPPLQVLGRGFMLVGEVIRRYCASGGDYAYWRVSPDNEPMLRWSRKAFASEGLVDQYEEWVSEKTLTR
ncbi:GNAT family N-acetyltransferase [bacterium]|nr:GNAT family N-acetyltransferase [bacterium]